MIITDSAYKEAGKYGNVIDAYVSVCIHSLRNLASQKVWGESSLKRRRRCLNEILHNAKFHTAMARSCARTYFLHLSKSPYITSLYFYRNVTTTMKNFLDFPPSKRVRCHGCMRFCSWFMLHVLLRLNWEVVYVCMTQYSAAGWMIPTQPYRMCTRLQKNMTEINSMDWGRIKSILEFTFCQHQFVMG